MDTEFTVAESRMTCEAAPVQIEGTLTDGRPFYWRARHRSIRLEVPPGTVVCESTWNMLPGAEDEHPMSSMADTDAYALLSFMVRTFYYTEEWLRRKESGDLMSQRLRARMSLGKD